MYQEIITTIITVIFLLLLLEIIKIRKHLIVTKEGSLPYLLEGDEDELYNEAKETAINMGKASASLFQRKFRIGYSRAANIIDALEDAEVIGPANGSKPREVLISKEQYAEMLKVD